MSPPLASVGKPALRYPPLRVSPATPNTTHPLNEGVGPLRGGDGTGTGGSVPLGGRGYYLPGLTVSSWLRGFFAPGRSFRFAPSP